MAKTYRRMFLNHRLIKQDEADREHQPPSNASDERRDWRDNTRGNEMHRVRTWRRVKPAFHTVEGLHKEVHITLWDEIDN